MSIKILSTNKKLSSWGGIYSVSTLYNKLNLSTHLRPALPKLKASYSSERNLAKIRQMILTFVAGADCLDDMEGLAKEPGLEGILGRDETYTSKSCGNFLRSFSNMNCKQLNYELINTGFKLRSQLPLEKQKSITIDLDSTINKQYGKKLGNSK
ncbi:MAG: transposase [Oligoflexales bacterium]|nr:transposase [Oligoflexales bacterium]